MLRLQTRALWQRELQVLRGIFSKRSWCQLQGVAAVWSKRAVRHRACASKRACVVHNPARIGVAKGYRVKAQHTAYAAAAWVSEVLNVYMLYFKLKLACYDTSSLPESARCKLFLANDHVLSSQVELFRSPFLLQSLLVACV